MDLSVLQIYLVYSPDMQQRPRPLISLPGIIIQDVRNRIMPGFTYIPTRHHNTGCMKQDNAWIPLYPYQAS